MMTDPHAREAARRTQAAGGDGAAALRIALKELATWRATADALAEGAGEVEAERDALRARVAEWRMRAGIWRSSVRMRRALQKAAEARAKALAGYAQHRTLCESTNYYSVGNRQAACTCGLAPLLEGADRG
jgi:hypothetical protein